MKTIILQLESLGSGLIIILSIALVVILFLALRALVLWYWKVDTIVENQEKQIELLSRIASAGNLSDVESKAKRYDAIEEAKQREHSKI